MKLFVCLFAFVASMMAQYNNPMEASNEQLTAKMLQALTQYKPGENVVLSAFSALTPLAQLTLASVGEPHDELLKLIGFPNDAVVKSAFIGLWAQLKLNKDVGLKMVNRLFVRKQDALNEEFAAMSKNVFNTDVQNIDFSKTDDAAHEMNRWIENSTNNVIQDIMDGRMLGSSTDAIFINANSFKGLWKDIFDWTSPTTNRDFYKSKDKVIKMRTMQRLGVYDYGESEELDAKIAKLPYNDAKSSLIVVLPNQIDGISSLIKKLADPLALSKATKNLSSKNVLLLLPKFKIQSTTNLKEVLRRMNIKEAFHSGQSRLDNLLQSPSDLAINTFIQKMEFDVHEFGTGEVTPPIGINAIAVIAKDPVTRNFTVDRPFYFALQVDNTIVFNGILYD